MSIDDPDQLSHLKAAGRVVAAAIRAMRAALPPRDMDEIGGRVFRRAGPRSGPQLDYNFPGVNCISVNDEAVHGIPGKRRLRPGDLVKLDVTAELDGFYADACVSVEVGPSRPSTLALVGAARHGLNDALRVTRAGNPLSSIGAAVEDAVSERGYGVC